MQSTSFSLTTAILNKVSIIYVLHHSHSRFPIPFQSPLFLSAFFSFRFSLSVFLFGSATTTQFSSISKNCIIIVYSIDLFHDIKLLKRFNYCRLHLKEFSRCIFEARCESAIKFAKIGRKKVRVLAAPEKLMS